MNGCDASPRTLGSSRDVGNSARIANRERSFPLQPGVEVSVLAASAGKVSIFAPSPLFTVTVELAADEEPEVHFHPGGQGFWAARMTKLLGVETSLCSVLGGESGQVLAVLLEAEGIVVRRVDGGAANGGYIHDRRTGEREIVVSVQSPQLSRHEVDDLYNVALADGIDAGIAVLTGNAGDHVLPAETYGRLANDFSKNGVRVVADISGGDLKSLTGGIHVLKVSHEDLLRDGFIEGLSQDDIVQFMESYRDVAENIVVSRADEPAWAMIQGKPKAIHPPQFEPLDHRGAGDSMTAAISAGLALGKTIEESLKLGAAAGALNVTRHGLGSGRRESVESLAKRVKLTALSRPKASASKKTSAAAPRAKAGPKKAK